jgi:hypothetical protein
VTQLTREDRRRMFDLTLYDDARRRHAADGALMDAHEKIARDDRGHAG